MYEHAYRNYYSNNISYPVLRPAVGEKAYTYEEQPRLGDAVITDRETMETSIADMPLNLKCVRRESRVDKLPMRTDLPLDLSNKS